MSERLRVAVIGAGRWGWQHARVFSERQDVQLCAIVGRTEERTRARAEEFGVPYYLSLAKMLEEVRPNLVSICLPNKEHFQATLEVIRAGAPLLAEKPLVFDLQEADALLAEAEQRGLFFAINFNHRYARPVQMAWRAIQEGHLGQLVFATWRFGGEGGDCREHENLVETQCHGFDMLEYLCGPIDSVMAQMTDATGKGWSTLSLALHFANGAVGSLVGSYDSSYAYPDTHRLEVNGTKGRLTVDDTVRRYSFQAAGSEVGEVWQAGYFNDIDREFKRTFDRYLEALLAAFRAGEGPPVHARAGRRALLLAQAAIRSFETGARVEVPSPQGHEMLAETR
jgi:predicted dehydrogenase